MIRSTTIKLTLCVLGSGSKGNAIYLRAAGTSLLIDAGLSTRQIGMRLAKIGVALDELDALLITHEHRDHLGGAKTLLKHHFLPLYLNRLTWEAGRHLLPPTAGVECFENGSAFKIGDLTVEAFSVSHDAADPVGFLIRSAEYKIAIATDLGYASNLVRAKLQGAHLIVLEANHDPQMLKNGPYPWEIKQRVWGRQGHLSNQQSAGLLRELYHPRLRHVVLAHVSEVNNLESLVRQEIEQALAECAADSFSCSIAKQAQITAPFHLP